MIYLIATMIDGQQIAVACDEATARTLLPIWAKAEPNYTSCRDINGTCYVALDPMTATEETALPAGLVAEVRDALEGDSNDAEHDALVSVAGHFGISYNDGADDD